MFCVFLETSQRKRKTRSRSRSSRQKKRGSRSHHNPHPRSPRPRRPNLQHTSRDVDQERERRPWQSRNRLHHRGSERIQSQSSKRSSDKRNRTENRYICKVHIDRRRNGSDDKRTTNRHKESLNIPRELERIARTLEQEDPLLLDFLFSNKKNLF